MLALEQGHLEETAVSSRLSLVSHSPAWTPMASELRHTLVNFGMNSTQKDPLKKAAGVVLAVVGGGAAFLDHGTVVVAADASPDQLAVGSPSDGLPCENAESVDCLSSPLYSCEGCTM